MKRVSNRIKYTGMFENASRKIFRNASELRKNMTEAEKVLWENLKTGINGIKFRRQHPIGKFIVDFYCHHSKLIIELDGSIHNDPEIAMIDRERELDLIAWGYKIIRFTNTDVLTNIDYILESITACLRPQQPPPYPR